MNVPLQIGSQTLSASISVTMPLYFQMLQKKDVGDIPAALDIWAVVVFSYPCSKNSCIAASNILLRRAIPLGCSPFNVFSPFDYNYEFSFECTQL